MSKLIIPAALMMAGLITPVTRAQSAISCTTTAQPPLVRAEGISERVGDIVFDCSGAPNTQQTLDFSLFLSVNITNRINAQNQTDVVLSIDTGSGPVPSGVPGVLTSPIALSFNGVTVPLSSSGAVIVRISGIRANASQSAQLSPLIDVNLSVGGDGSLSLTQTTLTVAQSVTGLYTSSLGTTVCDQHGSAGPSKLSFAAFVAAGPEFGETRLTEGFAYAFASKSDWQSLNADTGTRILVQYSGAPSTAALYVPQVIAGSDATQPTSAGLHGVAISGGKYTPGGNGSLLLSLVTGADSNGAGGTPVYTPGTSGSGTASFDQLSPVPLSNGAGYVVYEVMDSNDNADETALFPTFLTFPPILTGQTYDIIQQVSLAPVSSVIVASQTAPIPRFTGAAAPSDCPVMKDCTAPAQPAVHTVTSAANLTAGTVVAGSLATVTGTNLRGTQTVVTFNGSAAQLIYATDQQIDLLVPAAVAGLSTAKMFVSIDGETISQTVPLAPFSPALFQGAVLNPDNSLNTPQSPAKLGSTVQVYATGLASGGVVTVTIGNQQVTPGSWEPAKGIPGVQQISVPIPQDLALTGSAVSFSVCEAGAGEKPLCSPAGTLNVTQ